MTEKLKLLNHPRVCEPISGSPAAPRAKSLLVLGAALIFGMLLGAGGFLVVGGSPGQGPGRWGGTDERSGGNDGGAPLSPSVIRQARADLEDGDYEFFPNRRSIWIVNRTNGRMANYHFRDDEVGSVDRSRVATIDMKSFPREDTTIILSDRNLNNILWVCNRRTGDVQMWYPARDGTLRPETPIASSNDLRERNP